MDARVPYGKLTLGVLNLAWARDAKLQQMPNFDSRWRSLLALHRHDESVAVAADIQRPLFEYGHSNHSNIFLSRIIDQKKKTDRHIRCLEKRFWLRFHPSASGWLIASL